MNIATSPFQIIQYLFISYIFIFPKKWTSQLKCSLFCHHCNAISLSINTSSFSAHKKISQTHTHTHTLVFSTILWLIIRNPSLVLAKFARKFIGMYKHISSLLLINSSDTYIYRYISIYLYLSSNYAYIYIYICINYVSFSFPFFSYCMQYYFAFNLVEYDYYN